MIRLSPVSGISDKQEFPPLLPGGFHPMTVREFAALCVDGFPLSTTRQQIMEGFALILERLNVEGIEAEIWINGSFTTEKIDPEDVDFVVRVDSDLYDSSTGSRRDVLEWIENTHLKESHRSDCYLLVEWPIGHAMYPLGESSRRHWLETFGTSRVGQEKGLILLRTSAGGTSDDPTN